MTHWAKGLFFVRPALPGSISPKITVIECIENTLEWTCHSPLHYSLRACLHGGGGPQVGEVTRLGEVKK